jgi:integrase
MPRLGKRITIERGIYKDDRGFEVVARVGKRSRATRYPVGTALKTMRRWREGAIDDLADETQPTPDPNTLTSAIARYIAQTGLPTDHAYRPSLNAWQRELGDRKRKDVTPAIVSQILDRWKHQGYSPQSLYYRRLVLEKLWKALDGPLAKTPVDDLHIARPKHRRPRGVPEDVILRVLMELRKGEIAKKGRTAKTRARFLVLVTTGQRPAQLKRAERDDLDLERRIWWVRPAKGGERVPVYLNSEMLDAWEAFTRAEAWGDYDTRSFARTIRRAGWPAGVRVYNARHAFGFALSAAGADLGDIQLSMGHTDPGTTRAYVGGIEARMRDVSAKLEGRFRNR